MVNIPKTNFQVKKRDLPPKAKDYLSLIKACYDSGFTPLSKAMKEAGRRWNIQKSK